MGSPSATQPTAILTLAARAPRIGRVALRALGGHATVDVGGGLLLPTDPGMDVAGGPVRGRRLA